MTDKPRWDEIENGEQAFICHHCRKWFFDWENKLHIANTNLCHRCDHVLDNEQEENEHA